ncbi:MAG: NUDIX domain-containing protein [Bacilli bacterium]
MVLLGKIYSKDKVVYSNVIKRYACRAIIFEDDKLIMIHSKKYNEYKLPGGGVEENESLIDCLVREVKEETGLIMDKESLQEFGEFYEKRPSYKEEGTLFFQTSYYYIGRVKENTGILGLDDYEEEAGYEVVKIKPEDALKNNQLSKRPYSQRENRILEIIVEKQLWK